MYTATADGSYSVQVTVEGCMSEAATTSFVITGDLRRNSDFKLYPNPATDFIEISEVSDVINPELSLEIFSNGGH